MEMGGREMHSSESLGFLQRSLRALPRGRRTQSMTAPSLPHRTRTPASRWHCVWALGVTCLASVCCAHRPAAESTPREWFVEAGRTGSGTDAAPFGAIQDGLRVVQPGDVLTVRAGIYHEEIWTQRGGQEDRPIIVRAESGGGPVIVAASGRVLTVNHPFVTFDGLVFDGEYGANDTLLLTDRASHVIVRNC